MPSDSTLPLQNSPLHLRKPSRGFTTLEMVVVIAIGIITAAMAVPMIQSTMQSFRLGSAVSAVSGAIESTRYRAIYDGCPYQLAFTKAAIYDGCPYQLAFTKANNTYQVSTEATGGACAAAFTKVGNPIPFGSPQVALSQDVTFQFSPGGSVQVIAGAQTFNLSYIGSTSQKSITVSRYGSVKVQ